MICYACKIKMMVCDTTGQAWILLWCPGCGSIVTNSVPGFVRPGKMRPLGPTCPNCVGQMKLMPGREGFTYCVDCGYDELNGARGQGLEISIPENSSNPCVENAQPEIDVRPAGVALSDNPYMRGE